MQGISVKAKAEEERRKQRVESIKAEEQRSVP
jgi:hypothetical protein